MEQNHNERLRKIKEVLVKYTKVSINSIVYFINHIIYKSFKIIRLKPKSCIFH